ncbi:MAG: MarR family transcriptional regulator [Rhodospirillales bacterium]|nr:MarR family transcriptional regulator [Rhodospirillales bacterium]
MSDKPGSIPAIGQGKRGEEGHLGYLLRQANTVWRNRAEQALAAQGMTLPQFMALVMVGAYPGASSADLARAALLTPQTLSVIVANLERAGWIERHAHTVHGRIRQIALTRSGAAALSRARQAMAAEERALHAGLSAAEAKIVRRWLVQVAMASE